MNHLIIDGPCGRLLPRATALQLRGGFLLFIVEVIPLASKQAYLATAGAVDVAHLIRAFEEVNDCRLTVSMCAVERVHTSDLSITVIAHTNEDVPVEPAPLASLQFYRSASNFLTLDSAIIYALYQMDARLEDVRGGFTHPK